MEEKHSYARDVVEEGYKYLNPDKVSFVEWGKLEKFLSSDQRYVDFKVRVEKYCMWKALRTGILKDTPNKGFYLYDGKNPSMEGLPLFFTEINAIQEYRKETAQNKFIAMIIG